MTTRPTDILALRVYRDEAARRADALQVQLDKYPHREIKEEFERMCRLVDAYDKTIPAMST
jgi:hypothetical protein